jgi:hypothetical protein
MTDLNEAKNAVYAAASPILEAIEHAGGKVGNGHHVAQKIAEAFEVIMLARAPVRVAGDDITRAAFDAMDGAS